MHKQKGHKKCVAKPSNGNTEKQRASLIRKGVKQIVSLPKWDGVQVMGILDDAGVMQFIYPKSGKQLAFDANLLRSLRGECALVKGPIIFELVCWHDRFHKHAFKGTCGVSVRKTLMSIREFRDACLTLIVTTSTHGDTATERMSVLPEWFPRGLIKVRPDGSLQWPCDDFVGDAKPMVTHFTPWIFNACEMETRLSEIRDELSRENSPPFEGLVCSLVYESGNTGNNFPSWEIEPYQTPHVFKYKNQANGNARCTGVWRDNPEEGVDAVERAELVFRDRGTKTEVSMLSIPLDVATATKLKMALDCQKEVGVMTNEIRWYWNTGRGAEGEQESETRFLFVCAVLFDGRNLVHVRPPGDVFQVSTKKARASAEMSDLDRMKANRKNAQAREAKHKRNTEHSDWNLHTDTWCTQKEKEQRHKSNILNKQWFADLGAAMQFSNFESPQDTVRKAERKFCIKAVRQESQKVRDGETTSYSVAEQQAMIDRAEKCGISLNLQWKMHDTDERPAPTPSASKQEEKPLPVAVPPTPEELARIEALETERREVRRTIIAARDTHQYWSPPERKKMLARALACGILVGHNLIWPKLTRAAATAFERAAKKQKKAEGGSASSKEQKKPEGERASSKEQKTSVRAASPRHQAECAHAYDLSRWAEPPAVDPASVRLREAQLQVELDASHHVRYVVNKIGGSIHPLFADY